MSLWAFARVELGLSTDEFWTLTPREFSFLAQRYGERVKLIAAGGIGGLFGAPQHKSTATNLVDFLDGK